MTTRSRPFVPRHATLTSIEATDQIVATYFPAPHSYTGDDVVELSAHGSPVVLRTIVRRFVDEGARLAEPGEFTLRAFLNGRIDLMQAEAVGDLIDSVTPMQARAAFDQLQGTLTRAIGEIDAALFDLVARLEASIDFPEEGFHFIETGTLGAALDDLIGRIDALLATARTGRLVRDGLQIAIVGRPNVGKSSLFNALAGTSRAIVTDVPGTTRDLVTEVVDLGGLRATLVDTAGLTDSIDPVEAEGVSRARQAQRIADLTLLVLDRSRPSDLEDLKCAKEVIENKSLVVLNKIDLPDEWHRDTDTLLPHACVSATTGEGIDALRRAILRALEFAPPKDCPAITNVRHQALVERARASLAQARDVVAGADGSLSEEFVLADLQDARSALEEVSGKRAPEELLAHIFERFCVGK